MNAEYGRKRLTRVCRPVLKVSNIRTCQAGDPDDGTPQDSDPITRNVSISEDGAGGTHRDDEVGGPEEAIPCVCGDDRGDDEGDQCGVEQEEARVAVTGCRGDLPAVVEVPDEEDVGDNGENEQPPGRRQRFTVRRKERGDRQANVTEDGEWEGEVSEGQGRISD